MPHGPGKYDDVLTMARAACKAKAAILIVLGGEHGDGFSCQSPPLMLVGLPQLLRDVAHSIEADMADPVACPACGAMAGACSEYPNCPGGKR